ncbi:hypothetical protein TNIN_318081 [Trichonephila inaurata madagascariensis]|uniref:Uncharacterized protein n=1 Tax=Trichonephila inaurata madagascariensis TaxID=2747483 RepID=A0A8X7CTR6_9ARAC|nr:hypothetical protein TNIN_318081 [Trichonephila inaurata madagascariensis]
MAKGKALERKFSDIEKQISGFIMFVDTFDEDDKEVLEVLTVKLSQLEVLNIKFEEVKGEIFTSLTDADFENFDAKITTCAMSIFKLGVPHLKLILFECYSGTLVDCPNPSARDMLD